MISSRPIRTADTAATRSRCCGNERPTAETNKNEGKGVFAILSERGVRTIVRRPERREHDRRDQDGRADAEEKSSSLAHSTICRHAKAA